MAQTTLCFDFGNTRLKCAVFKDKELHDVVVMEDDNDATIRQLVDTYQPQKSILSSVVNHNPEMESILAAATQFHKLDHLSKIPVTTPVGKPQDIGADRLAVV